jgi:hypothetical protein
MDQDRIDAADAILGLGDLGVCKSTRAGFTTSAVAAASCRGLKTLLVAPTRNILTSTVRETVEKLGGTLCDIPGHGLCKYLEEKTKGDPILKQLPIHLPDCTDCPDFKECPVTEIERIEDLTTATTTYAKIESVMVSRSEAAQTIQERLSGVDLVILDEAHVLSVPSLCQVDFEKHIHVPDGYPALKKVLNRWMALQDENRDQTDYVQFLTEQNPNQYTGFQVQVPDVPSWQELAIQWSQLIELAKARAMWQPDISDQDILDLRDIITILSGQTATISYIHGNDMEMMMVSAGQGRDHRALQEFLTKVVPNAQIIFVSGTLVERRPGFFAGLSGREIKGVTFPDLRDTNSKMHIHPSKWTFSAWDSKEGLQRAIDEIKAISESVDNQPIYLVAMNARYAAQIRRVLKNDFKILEDYSNITVDYYRSSDTIGVGQDARIGIVLGLAHLPKHACDPLAQGENDTERFHDSQQLRLNSVHAATWQAWSRVKDPAGVVDSHVYCIGVRADEISDVVTWGTNRVIHTSIGKKGNIECRIKVDKELPRPVVCTEIRTSRGLNRHGIEEYIDRIVPASHLIEYRTNHGKSTHSHYNINSGNVNIFRNTEAVRLYNNPGNQDESESTSFGLAMLFIGRSDYHARQSKWPDWDGKYGYRKQETRGNIPDLLTMHLSGAETFGFYPFDALDTCYYCAIDLDNHSGDTPQRDNVMRLSHFLLDNGLPVIVEKSGSADSYHVWVPIMPTKTYTAHKFVRQLLHDAGIEGAEAYPKQKSIRTCDKGCGNFLKTPLGINRKNNVKSTFIDPWTFEPVAFIEVDKVVSLREVPETKSVKNKPRRSIATGSNPRPIISDMLPCAKRALADKVVLDGSEGHWMRVCIAIEAQLMGLPIDNAVDLFKDQPDFDLNFTRDKIMNDVWPREYHRFSCEKLREECGSIVGLYCAECEFGVEQ